MPDLDIDFADTGREKVIEYVRQKYGENNVAQIITFGSMQSRLAVRDVGRVLDIPLSDVDKIAKLIPGGSTIYSAMNDVDELKKLVESRNDFKELISVSQKIEGIKRHVGVHAAGLLISKDDMMNYVPFTKSPKQVVTTQYEGEYLVSLGLLKMDFLGLKNLSIIEETIQLIKKYRNIDLDIGKIPLDDKKTYELLKDGKAIGVFQMESSGMRELLKKIKPETIEDVIALIALYRPGPMGSGMLDDFVNRKHGKSPIVYDHPILEPVLKDTYGVILYQEQVMRIAIDLAGFTPAQSDNLRKAMGKKIPEILEKEKSNFVNGALAKDVKKEIAEKVFDNIIKFGGYGFNKSHSTAYGFVSYRTAYLKANFPVEYMTALLNSASGDSDSVMNYISECSDMNIEVLPVNIQKSFEKFSIEDLENNKIRLGFSVVKGVGEGSAEAIVKARENNDFKSLTDMLRRVEPNSLNKKVVENLAKAGAFDCLNYKRASVFEGFESIVASVNRSNKDLNSGQISFFDQIEDLGENTEELPDVSEWHESILLSYEKEVLGFYMTGHPLVNLKKEIKAFSSTCIKDILDKKSRTEIKIVGFVNNIKKLKTKKGDLMCFMNFEDLTGETEVLVFPKTYSQYSQNFDKDQIVFLKAKVDAKEEKVNLIAEEILEFSEAKKVYVKELIINIEQVFLDEENMEKLKSILTDEINSEDAFIRVILNVKSTNHGFVKIDTKKNINLNEKLENDLKDIFGKNCISYRIK